METRTGARRSGAVPGLDLRSDRLGTGAVDRWLPARRPTGALAGHLPARRSRRPSRSPHGAREIVGSEPRSLVILGGASGPQVIRGVPQLRLPRPRRVLRGGRGHDPRGKSCVAGASAPAPRSPSSRSSTQGEFAVDPFFERFGAHVQRGRLPEARTLTRCPPRIDADPYENDPARWGHSLANLAEILLGCLDARGAKSVVEIGAYAGDLTRVLLDWAAAAGGTAWSPSIRPPTPAWSN